MKSIKPPSTLKKMLNPSLDYADIKARVKFNGDCLKQDKIAFDHWKIVNIYIVYAIEKSDNISSYPTVENCLCSQINKICANILHTVLNLIERDFFYW